MLISAFFERPFLFVFLSSPVLLRYYLKVKPSLCLWSSSNVMCRQSQCSVGSSVSSYLGSSSLNWEPARLRLPIWIIIISLLQGMVPVSAAQQPSPLCRPKARGSRCSWTRYYRQINTDASLSAGLYADVGSSCKANNNPSGFNKVVVSQEYAEK